MTTGRLRFDQEGHWLATRTCKLGDAAYFFGVATSISTGLLTARKGVCKSLSASRSAFNFLAPQKIPIEMKLAVDKDIREGVSVEISFQ